ncbi:MAG: hypothetical protein AAGF46_11395, partial [Pseudomonadota bacterium]
IWLKRLFGDNRYLLSARVTSASMYRARVPAWLYYIDLPIPNQPGTPHGSDGYFIWQGERVPIPGAQQLGERLRRLWLSFARDGRPDTADNWPAITHSSGPWRVFSTNDTLSDGVIPQRLDFLVERYQRRVAPAQSRGKVSTP